MPSTVSQYPATRNCRVLLLINLTFVILSLIHGITPSTARDTITPNQPLTDQETLVSSGEVFELGFFTPNGSTSRYIGIWYHNIPDQIVLWVANGKAPLIGSGGVLSLTAKGNLTLLDINGSSVWSTNTTNIASPIVQLFDTGNLVLTHEGDDIGSQSFVWQSFDYITNAMLPGMKLGFDLRTNLTRRLTSWKTASDPSPGVYTEAIVGGDLPEVYMWNGSSIMSRIGWWDGRTFIGVTPIFSPNFLFFQFQFNQDETFYSYETVNSSIKSVVILDQFGTSKRLVWLNNQWGTYTQHPTDMCDMYAKCSTYGFCETVGSSLTSCDCLRGFEPTKKKAWVMRDWSGGCVRRMALNCSSDGFVLVSGLKLPDNTNSSLQKGMGLDECKAWCLKNCSCEAIAIIIGEVNGCLAWFGSLIDMRQMVGGGHDLYLRLAASELDPLRENSSKKNLIIGTTVSAILGIALLTLVKVLLSRKKRRQGMINDYHISDIRGREMELQLFDLRAILIATNYFSLQNKLGEGGFGQVYKGQMEDGQEIAVKRLSKESVQGLDEFKNEAILIAKLQHRNLVRLLGCCIQGDERMLVYEYMQHKSLDYFIFDDTKHELLEWQKRVDIILGIARGLLYLHQDSRFKIIHRDLKASNILLDKEMNPKISDFGIARIFKGDQMQENTDTVMGTIGYMAPEYAMDGIFSVKSDVFSFGVLVLEILSGKKNKVAYDAEPNMDLLAQAWRLWNEGNCLELLDKSLQYSCPVLETMRCIQVALLCVQERSDDRPDMASVVMMLGSEAVTIPPPERPGFCIRKNTMEIDISSTVQHSTSEVTVTVLHGR